jgi:aminoglycoside phosphotransferase (APT) family kinase protein
MRMHDDQVDVTVEVVAGLVAAQFPRWQGLAVRPVRSHGTVNALFRLGDHVVLRFPLRPGPAAREELVTEQENARRFASYAPVEVPEPLGLGAPGPGYPGAWAAYRWISGTTADDGDIADLDGLALDLAGFVRAVRGLDTGGRSWSGQGRGGPLSDEEDWVRHSLAQSAEVIDIARVGRLWARCRDIPIGDTTEVWLHGDLMPGNLLLRDGRLAGVLDLGMAGVGDPAVDLMPAWNLLDPAGRVAYRKVLGVDDATWERGRGWAILQAIGAVWYYAETNPVMAGLGRRTLAAVLADD